MTLGNRLKEAHLHSFHQWLKSLVVPKAEWTWLTGLCLMNIHSPRELPSIGFGSNSSALGL